MKPHLYKNTKLDRFIIITKFIENAKLVGLGVGLSSLCLYYITLCPGLAWGGGDSAKFAIWVKKLNFQWTPSDHPLYVLAAYFFSLLPIKASLAYILNLFSALNGSLTVCILYYIVYMLTTSTTASLAAAASFAVSHTFWMHSLLTEVYTFHTMLLSIFIYLLLAWQKKGGKGFLYAACFIFGLGVSNHLLFLLTLPGVFIFLFVEWWKNKRLFLKDTLFMAFLALAGAFMLVWLTATDVIQGDQVTSIITNLIGIPIIESLNLSIKRLLLFVGLLLYNFPLFGFLLGICGFFAAKQQPFSITLLFIFLFITFFLFPVCYNVRDNYQFAISAYLIFAIFIGFGFVFSLGESSPLKKTIYLVCLSTISLFFYYGTAAACNYFSIDVIKARMLPYRNNNFYFLYPPKNKDRSAERYGKEVLSRIEPYSFIVGDYTPIMVIKYFQEIEGLRPDVETFIGLPQKQIDEVKKILGKRPVYIAAIEENSHLIKTGLYLTRNDLKEFVVESIPPVFKITSKN